MNLPKQAGAWSRPETPRRITAQTIFDYMDGAGELYVGYRFGHLDVYEYTAADQSLGTILVELYWMQTSDDAFGLLSTDWGGEPVGLGEAAPDDKRVQVVPPQRALYGAGLLRAWSGDLYLRILASRETPHSREAVFALARAATSGRPNPPVPAVTAVLPGGAPSPATGGTVPEPYLLRPDRTCFFRSYLVLNSAYFLASQDLLDLGPQVEGVTTEYRSSRTAAGRMRIVLVRYPSADAARGAAVKFLQGYVPEKASQASAAAGRAKLEHGWLAWATTGASLALVLDAPSAREATTLAAASAREVARIPKTTSGFNRHEDPMTIRRIITRRDFVLGTVGTVTVAAGAASVTTAAVGGVTASGEHADQAPRRAPKSARVVVVRHAEALNDAHGVNLPVLDRMLADTVMRVTGQKTSKDAWLSLVKPTDTVGLVPTPHLNPTHRELVEAVRKALVAAGIPAERIVEAQGSIDKPRACTALIAMPALKAHWLTGLGTSLKLYIMYSGRPSSYHNENNVNLADTWLLPDVKGKTRLVLLDALRPLCDKGPQPDPRYMWDYKGLIASTDPVAVDAVGLQIIMEKRKAIRGEPWPLSPPPLCVAAADERFGLGTSRLDEITIEKAGWAQDILL